MVAQAESVPAQHAVVVEERLEDSVGISYGVVSYQAPRYILTYGVLGVSNHLWLAPALEVGAGLRFGFGDDLVHGNCFEGWGSVALVPHFGIATDAAGRTASWRPAVGLEVGGTTATYTFPDLKPGAIDTGSATKGVYAALLARPLRFRFGRFNASIIGVTFGTMVANPGRQLRIQLEAVHAAVAF